MQTETTAVSATTNNSTQKPTGTSFDLARKLGEVDGKPQWEKHGTLFLRANGSGGIIYLKLGDQELEIAVFPRRAKR
jgi:hypothetical protein